MRRWRNLRPECCKLRFVAASDQRKKYHRGHGDRYDGEHGELGVWARVRYEDGSARARREKITQRRGHRVSPRRVTQEHSLFAKRAKPFDAQGKQE
jgi:hypothetical protein